MARVKQVKPPKQSSLEDKIEEDNGQLDIVDLIPANPARESEKPTNKEEEQKHDSTNVDPTRKDSRRGMNSVNDPAGNSSTTNIAVNSTVPAVSPDVPQPSRTMGTGKQTREPPYRSPCWIPSPQPQPQNQDQNQHTISRPSQDEQAVPGSATTTSTLSDISLVTWKDGMPPPPPPPRLLSDLHGWDTPPGLPGSFVRSTWALLKATTTAKMLDGTDSLVDTSSVERPTNSVTLRSAASWREGHGQDDADPLCISQKALADFYGPSPQVGEGAGEVQRGLQQELHQTTLEPDPIKRERRYLCYDCEKLDDGKRFSTGIWCERCQITVNLIEGKVDAETVWEDL
ncbi:hypothetical protein EJ08DRAFT_703121 [Tothia fuscella]|uniref:Uncharacterized protein n=1 Tax=Tothia fuscella TaxID=1048955 RepID=A0A9P4NF28_9PEZI|nr:hypothetical protein EJ08DRAFT_703121 [Tothia fuscella]